MNTLSHAWSDRPAVQNPDTDASPADIAALVASERLGALYSATTSTVLLGLLFCLLPFVFLWGKAPSVLLLAWLGSRILIGGLRCIDALHYRSRRPGPADTASWSRRFTALLALDGLSWGAMGLLQAPTVPGLDGALLASLVGVCAIGLLKLSDWRTYLMFAVLSLGPLLLQMLWQGTPAGTFSAAGLAIFIGVSVMESRRMEARSMELMRLRFSHAHNAEMRQRALLEARRLNDSKTRLVAMMSHEIRTPLNGMLGMAQLLERSTLTAQQRAQIGLVQRSGRHLLDLVNDMLDLARIESGKLQIAPAPLPLRDTLDEVCRLLSGQAVEKGLRLELQASEDLPQHCLLDAARLRQVLHNLIGNAIKYTEAGGICVEACMHAGRLRFSVRDSGEGIAADALERIFAPFEQVGREGYRKREGTGLGLAISRELVRAMGGELSCISTPDHGSCFSFELPFLPCAARASGPDGSLAAPELPRLHGRVLLVEDDPVNLLVASSMLERCGLQVEQAEDGNQALARLEQLQADEHFDIVLMDCQMPGLDGFEATRRWRNLEQRRQRAPMPIVALTANAGSADRQRCLDCGMNDYLSKPFEIEQLLAVVQARLHQPVLATPT
ncbi:ATP-binding protein [Roseateles sp.]|jgi:signal transduction histidine kinase/CheY-like chemotaxis protein|uniref:ATP-binding protein n=1 Tax=Roseateles sp. TaxID=1971397 RepID=UPI0037CA0D48